MANFWRRPGFAAISAEWYQRLKDDGFKDLEPVPGGLLGGNEGGQSKVSAQEQAATAAYYTRAWSAVQSFDFLEFWNARERKIIELRVGAFDREPLVENKIPPLVKASKRDLQRVMARFDIWISDPIYPPPGKPLAACPQRAPKTKKPRGTKRPKKKAQ